MHAKLVIACACVLCIFLLPKSRAEVNHEAIQAVAAGQIKTAKASWWGFDPTDATDALQAAINSGVPTLIVDNVGKPWIVRPIQLVSNQEIIFEKGVEVVAKKGEFKGITDCLFSAFRKENVTLRGPGAVLRMHRDDYAGPDYKKAEWRHVVQFRSCSNVKVIGLTLAESGGDGIYLGIAEPGVTNKGVVIRDVICERNYRQGISVITAEDLLIENVILRDTAGTPPQAGIDFEPNRSDERLVNCVMRNCVSEGNMGCGYVLYLNALDAQSAPVSVRIENCRAVRNAGPPVAVSTNGETGKGVHGKIEFVDCTLQPLKSSAIVISGKPVGTCAVRFERCVVEKAEAEVEGVPPIAFVAGREMTEPAGDVEFIDVVVPHLPTRKPMAFVDQAGGVGLRNVTGTLILKSDGEQRNVPLTEEILAEWLPVLRIKPIPRLDIRNVAFVPVDEGATWKPDAAAFVRLRRSATFALFAKQGEKVTMKLGHLQVGRYSGDTMPVTVMDWHGNEVLRAQVPFNEESEVAFTADATGLYRISADPGTNCVAVTSSSHPIVYCGDTQSIHLIGTTGELFFWVPAGTREFGVRVTGEPMGEGVKATLLDPSGNVVEEVDDLVEVHQFTVTLPQESAGEAWSLRIAKPSTLALDDYYIELRGIPGLFAPTKEALLRPVQ